MNLFPVLGVVGDVAEDELRRTELWQVVSVDWVEDIDGWVGVVGRLSVEDAIVILIPGMPCEDAMGDRTGLELACQLVSRAIGDPVVGIPAKIPGSSAV